MSTSENMNGRMWLRMMKNNRAKGDLTVPCDFEHPELALREAMHQLDLSMPVWLPRHQKDWQEFSLTRFTADHFLEPIHFDRLEISYIAPDDKKKKKRNPMYEV
ncbi:MAG TPA: hypothetical protein PK537_02380 [Candidatus Limiplasma sp.]|nr:hypothetical protein [Candidatus Limiplasma sp.]